MENLQNLLYLLSACLLIIGLKMLGSPKTAVRGHAIGAVGMLIAAAVAPLLGAEATGPAGALSPADRLTAIAR